MLSHTQAHQALHRLMQEPASAFTVVDLWTVIRLNEKRKDYALSSFDLYDIEDLAKKYLDKESV